MPSINCHYQESIHYSRPLLCIFCYIVCMMIKTKLFTQLHKSFQTIIHYLKKNIDCVIYELINLPIQSLKSCVIYLLRKLILFIHSIMWGSIMLVFIIPKALIKENLQFLNITSFFFEFLFIKTVQIEFIMEFNLFMIFKTPCIPTNCLLDFHSVNEQNIIGGEWRFYQYKP